MSQLVGGGRWYQDHREDKNCTDSLERYHHRERNQGQ